MKKSLYIFIVIGLLFLGINNVSASEKKFTCSYKADFSDFSGKKIDFSVVVYTDDQVAVSSFDNVSGTTSTGGQNIILQSKFTKKFLNKASNGGNTCPNLGLNVDGSGNAYISVLDSSAEDGVRTMTGTYEKGTVEEDKKTIICSRTQKLRNDKDIKVEFYTIGTSRQWSISYATGTSETSGNATDAIGFAGNSFYMDDDIVSMVYEKNICEPIYFTIPDQATVHLSTTKPSDSENASYSVKDSTNDTGKGVSTSSDLNPKKITSEKTNPIATTKSCVKCNNTYIPYGLSIFSRNLITFIQLMVPVIIIITGMVELVRSVMAGDDKKMEEAKPKLIRKIIAGVIIMLIFALVKLGIGFLGTKSKGILRCASYFINTEATKVDCPERGQLNIDYGTSDNTEETNEKIYQDCSSSCSSKYTTGTQDYAKCLTECQANNAVSKKCWTDGTNYRWQVGAPGDKWGQDSSKTTEQSCLYSSCYSSCSSKYGVGNQQFAMCLTSCQNGS